MFGCIDCFGEGLTHTQNAHLALSQCNADKVWGLLAVTLVFPEDRLMARLFTPEIASYYEKYYQDKGIKLMKGELASGFVDAGDGSVKAVELKSGGTIPADLVVVGAGAKPNVDLFEGQLDLLEDKPGGVKVHDCPCLVL